jgi:hypothetical protein
LRNAVARQITRPPPQRRSSFASCTEARLRAATLVQVAESMDALDIGARRTALITDLLPDAFP